jgi:hypothetical protein
MGGSNCRSDVFVATGYSSLINVLGTSKRYVSGRPAKGSAGGEPRADGSKTIRSISKAITPTM